MSSRPRASIISTSNGLCVPAVSDVLVNQVTARQQSVVREQTVVREIVARQVTMAMRIEFGHNSTDINAQYFDCLGKVAHFIAQSPAVTATVKGPCANATLDASTLDASIKTAILRAHSLVNYFVENFGLMRTRLIAESRYIAYSEDAYQKNEQENQQVNVILNYPKMR
jgi:outer membrane protein OmpA-like peptidoglycan-associated protein